MFVTLAISREHNLARRFIYLEAAKEKTDHNIAELMCPWLITLFCFMKSEYQKMLLMLSAPYWDTGCEVSKLLYILGIWDNQWARSFCDHLFVFTYVFNIFIKADQRKPLLKYTFNAIKKEVENLVAYGLGMSVNYNCRMIRKKQYLISFHIICV